MRPAFLLAIITLALGGAGNAVSQTWNIDGEHGLPTAITALSAHRQQQILTGLGPSLIKLAKESDLDSAAVAEVERTLLVLDISVVSGKLSLIQGLGPDLCGTRWAATVYFGPWEIMVNCS